MKLFTIILLNLYCFICFSQDSIQGKAIILHPSVGKIIDNTEKKQYKLFPEYKDSTYSSAFIVKFNDTTYLAVITNIKNQNVEKSISIKELDEMYYKVDNISKKENPTYNKEIKKKRRHSGPNNPDIVYRPYRAAVYVAYMAVLILALY